MDFALSPAAQLRVEQVQTFVRERVMPVEAQVLGERAAAPRGPDWTQWTVSPAVEALKAEARAAGLWNLFLPEAGGVGALDYAPLAEEMGWSFLAPEVMNCNAPDTGNMEVLQRFGSPAQQARWLEPLLRGELRSAFCMTEPAVASSDATNMAATARIEGDEVVLQGRKWWSTGLGHPRCAFTLFMGVTDPAAERHQRHSIVLVPMDTPGVRIERMLTVFGDYDDPYGHGEVRFDGVRLPVDHIVGGPGMGFLIAQSRLGPGRIHHCMRCVGGAERALGLAVERGRARTAFGKPLLNLGGNRERIADARIAIDQARLLTLFAAWRLEQVGPIAALGEISAIKVVAPNVLQQVVDMAIQLHGGAGLSQDTPLAGLFALARVLRIADGPDEVHRGVIARLEMARHRPATR